MIFLALVTAFVTGGLFTWYFVGGHFATKAFEYQTLRNEALRSATRAHESRDLAHEAWMLWEQRARELGWSDSPSPKDVLFYERLDRMKAPSNE